MGKKQKLNNMGL